MSTRRLGNSDLNITPVGFGAWAIGGTGYDFAWGKQDDADSIAAIQRSLELGVNWIDTAPVYGTGHSEEIVASALKEWRGSRPYVFTKCVMRWDEKHLPRSPAFDRTQIGGDAAQLGVRNALADLIQRRGDTRLRAAVNDNFCAFRRQGRGNCQPYSSCRARHNRRFAS